MEIKVGEYVRVKDSKKGTIIAHIVRKLEKEDNHEIYRIDNFYKHEDCYPDWNLYDIDILKHSPNIIDLIEEGDYVNGYKVELSRYNELYISYVYCGGIGVRTTEAYATFIKDMKVEDIESIVTKEQFAEMEYKV